MSWNLVQQKAASNSTAAQGSIAVTLTSPVTAGNLLVVVTFTYDGSASPPTISSITDNQGNNTYVLNDAQKTDGNATPARIASHHVAGCGGGATTFTANFSSATGSDQLIWVGEFSGQAASPLGLTNSNSDGGTAGTIVTTGAVNPPDANSLYIAVMEANGVVESSETQPAGWTAVVNNDPATEASIAYLVASGSQNPQWTLAAASNWAAFVVTFKQPAITVAAGQNSASWTDPAAGIKSALTFAAGQVSASWTDPAPGFSSALSLTANASAAWTDAAPGIQAAFSFAAGVDSAAWTNAAITITSGGGGSFTLTGGPNAAAWTNPAVTIVVAAGRLTVNFGTENLYLATSGNIGQEWVYMQNTEGVIFFRKTADGTFDAGTVVANALRLEVLKDMTGGSLGVLSKNSLRWLLWNSQTGNPAPKIGDVIQDAGGTRWSAWNVDIQAWGARYLIETRQER